MRATGDQGSVHVLMIDYSISYPDNCAYNDELTGFTEALPQNRGALLYRPEIIIIFNNKLMTIFILCLFIKKI